MLLPDVLRIAPLPDTPVPVMLIGSALKVTPPDTFNAALFATVVAPAIAPSDAALLIAATPWLMLVAPV